jgi:hypothetical protein
VRTPSEATTVLADPPLVVPKAVTIYHPRIEVYWSWVHYWWVVSSALRMLVTALFALLRFKPGYAWVMEAFMRLVDPPPPYFKLSEDKSAIVRYQAAWHSFGWYRTQMRDFTGSNSSLSVEHSITIMEGPDVSYAHQMPDPLAIEKSVGLGLTQTYDVVITQRYFFFGLDVSGWFLMPNAGKTSFRVHRETFERAMLTPASNSVASMQSTQRAIARMANVPGLDITGPNLRRLALAVCYVQTAEAAKDVTANVTLFEWGLGEKPLPDPALAE